MVGRLSDVFGGFKKNWNENNTWNADPVYLDGDMDGPGVLLEWLLQ